MVGTVELAVQPCKVDICLLGRYRCCLFPTKKIKHGGRSSHFSCKSEHS